MTDVVAHLAQLDRADVPAGARVTRSPSGKAATILNTAALKVRLRRRGLL